MCVNRQYVVDDTCQNRWFIDDDLSDGINGTKQICYGCPICHICMNGNCTMEEANGMQCDDGNPDTFRDTCYNGTCSRTECEVNCFDETCMNQNHMLEPCCNVGNCTQVNATQPTCQGGYCD